MLIEFKVSNFRSIREEQTFSLVAGNADKSLPSCVIDRELPGLSGVKFLKGAAIYGANASGKSNVIEAMFFVSNFVKRSAINMQPGDPTGAEPFKLDKESASKPSVFEITFVANDTRYVFGFSLTTQQVLEEYLVAYPNGAPQHWYHRTLNATTKAYEWSKKSTSFKEDRDLQDKTRENALFLSVGPQFNNAQLTEVYTWFWNNLKFIDMSKTMGTRFTAELMGKDGYHDRILSLLKRADIGVFDAKIQVKEMSVEEVKKTLSPTAITTLENVGGVKPRKIFDINLGHKGDGDEAVFLDFKDEESTGTRRFFSLVGPWADILDHGYTVFIDEIEASLHPILVRELLKLLFSETGNRKGAQVIFTTHNTVLLDRNLIRRDQIWFTEKSQNGATSLYPLTDYRPRNKEALEKGYLLGRYGAIPFIPEGLVR